MAVHVPGKFLRPKINGLKFSHYSHLMPS
ncbi:hypothetical protein CUMW_177100 [Citrus unshiu]|nr:hypothetical protein CUMW_177100 [Citrus unshiu]